MATSIENCTETASRRAFLRGGAVLLGSLSGGDLAAEAFSRLRTERLDPLLRVGLVTDLHYADIDTKGTRHYRDALEKARRVVAEFNRRELDAVVEIGDLVDEGADAKAEASYVERVDRELAKLRAERHYVLGNHCIWTLTKEEFFGSCLDRKPKRRSYYSFDRGGIHIVLLDACFRADGTPYARKNNAWTDTEIPLAQREWLAKDLAATRRPTLVFVHQRLDVGGNYGVKSAAAVRKVLSSSGKVLAVFQGHNHTNDLREIGGVHYVTCDALIDGPASDPGKTAYGVLEVHPGGVLRLEGFQKQKSHRLARLV